LALFLGIIIFAAWQLAKKIKPAYFNPGTEEAKKKVAILITNVNGVIAIIFAVLAVGFKLAPDIATGVGVMMTVFANGSLFDLLKAYGAIK
jgi:fatty acid desaturase